MHSLGNDRKQRQARTEVACMCSEKILIFPQHKIIVFNFETKFVF
jgi:hypothetical protein